MNSSLDVDLQDNDLVSEIMLLADLMVAASESPEPLDLETIDETLGLSRSTNAYVRSAWAELAIANRYDPALPSVRAFVASVGRGLLIRPIYEGLMAQGEWGKPIAKRFFEEARPTYHPVTAAQIAKIVGAN